ncbi:acyl-CoA synthetase MbcS [Virgibacillus sp. Bac330]|uniref:acyl-CoA synthetase MbcS n=1 Tax=Virgibacillus sp. Bac330 TaxID=2419841 RepID=UPI000EF4C5F8|nr:acyl--CoA ligase [Virgibacillus sp. Bac330]
MKREALIPPKAYNIAMEIERHANCKNKLALIKENEFGETDQLTYKELVKQANQIGNVFLKAGLKKGDKILIMVNRSFEAYEVYLAALKTGIIIIPSSEMLKTKDLQYRVSHGEVSGVVSLHRFANQFEGIREYDQLHKFVIGAAVDGWVFLDEEKKQVSEQLEVVDTSREDTAFLPYTSGTTGNPKGVVHSHAWGYAHLKAAAYNWLAIQDGDRVWATAGPGWQKWVWSPFLSVLGTGATGFFYTGKFNAEKHLQLIDDYEINIICSTPTEYRMMAKVDSLPHYKLTSLHSAVSAGEPLNVEVIDIFKHHFNITVRDGYGQTENTLLLGFTKDMQVRPGSMGKPTPGNNVEVIDENGVPLGPNEVGDIAVRLDSPALFSEYYKDTERTSMAKRGSYYITGDRAYKDEDGFFWFEGRSDDIIISSGYTIGPFEVEDALIRHTAVQDCAVVASPDEIRGNVVKAFIVLREGFQPSDQLIEELQNHVKTITGPYKYPRKIEFMDDLPKTTSGKTRRVELRNKEKVVNK